MLRVFLLALLVTSSNVYSELMVEKKTFSAENFTTFGGKSIAQINVGWESYGTLNEQKNNVILITHYFTGSSHAAGKYHPSDSSPGYWDAIIGPGKAIDTNRFFVISVDSLVNLGVHDPKVITTGPASIDPATGKPYGLTFPVVTIRDFVNVQKMVLGSLGIDELYAVIGPSMGSMQAIDWAVAYPDKVKRLVSVIGSGQSDAWTTAFLEHWATPIKLDANWRQGNYYDSQAPIAGLTHALMLITQNALSPAFFNQVGKQQLAYQPLEKAPLNNILHDHSIVKWLKQRAQSRANLMDANHLLYLVRACQLFVAGHNGDLASAVKNIQAPTLFLPATEDLLLMPYHATDTHTLLQAANKSSQLSLLDGPLGHLEGVAGIAGHAELIRHFLTEPQGDKNE
ncbi:homoserine O-acetyltransferase [Aliiglaciecola sp.]|nr:homoserine O-acetyltransferase [Aliiglaciecola sp.]